MNRSLLEFIACPRHQTELFLERDRLTCGAGCRFPIVQGVPVLLVEEAPPTQDVAQTSLRQAQEGSDDDWHVDSIGATDEEKAGIRRMAAAPGEGVDPVVSFLVSETNGLAYRSQVGCLNEYPIPELRLPPTRGQVLLDVGCSWGRWCIAAWRKGYRVIGIDPSLGAVMAASRVARQLGIDAAYIVGDARFLPLRAATIDCVFSYSVIQHFSRENAAAAIAEIGRVLKEGGECRVQMPTRYGLRCLYHQIRRGFREEREFEVRYWTLPSLRRLFAAEVGPTRFVADCFFGIGLQYSDLRFMTPVLKVVVAVSEALRVASEYFVPLRWVADSVYVCSVKKASEGDRAADHRAQAARSSGR